MTPTDPKGVPELDPAGPPGGAPAGTRRRLLWVLLGAIVVAVLVAGVRTERRVEHDAAFCATSCHHTAKAGTTLAHLGGWTASGHAGVECQSCHVIPLRSGVTLFWKSLVGSTPIAPHGEATAETCVGCHEKQPADWRVVAETQGHRAHRDLRGLDCLSCHAGETHPADPPALQAEKTPPGVCTTCHKKETIHKPTTLGAETCLSCHAFAVSAENRQAPTPVTCEKCHADARALVASGGGALRPMKDVNAHALHGDVACQLCHNPHGKKLEAPAGQPVCVSCHQVQTAQVTEPSAKGPEGHRKCEGCHEPHAPRASALQTCVNCHEAKAKGLTAAGVEKTTALEHASCASCHLPHTWRAERSGCLECHKKEAALVATRSPIQHSDCTSCHDIHGPPPTGAVCLNCHSKTKGDHVALAPERHKDCTSCHDPHAPRPEDTRASCAKCHTAESAQVMTTGPEGHAKTGCLGCHQPHADPAAAPNICGKCHADKAALVAAAGPPKHQLCTSCHEKHEFRITEVAETCGKCHGTAFQTAPGETKPAPHQGACKGCHTFHGSPGVSKTACFGCHQNVEKAFHPPNAQHASCGSCHAPHTPANKAPARCVACHAPEGAAAAKWPPSSAHAQACNGCHEPHDVRVKKTCSECHAAETASAEGSKHQCTQCHAPHQEPPGTGRAWWSRCAQCHADKVESVKARGPVHSDCKNCHEQHRFSIPTCTTCHADIKTKGLHAIDKHAASCTSCHDPHVRADPKPAQCLSCHTDRRTHEPNAQRCQACHLFK